MNIGYLTPDIQPEQMSCVQVFYPDDPLYLSALLGSLAYLSTWKAWEKDEAKTGKVAASLWKDALDLTVDKIALGCGSNQEGCELCDMTKDELIQYVTEALEQMTINNNINIGCGCGCGCGCSGGGTDVPTDIPIDTNPPVPEIPAGDIPTTAVTNDACAIAHFLAIEWRNLVLGMENGDYSRDRYNSWITELFVGAWDWVVSTAQVFLETVGLIGGVSSGTSEKIDAHFIELKCAILQGGSQQEVAARCNGVIDLMGFGFLQSYTMKKLLNYMPLTAPFDSSVGNVSSEYYVAGCPACVTPVPEPIEGVDTFFDNVNYGTGGTLYDALFLNGEQVQFGTPYLIESTYYDVPGQTVDAFRIFWRVNDGVGGKMECDVRIENVEGWEPRPNDAEDSMWLKDEDVATVYRTGDTVPIAEGDYLGVWEGQLLGASENADRTVQYDPFKVWLTFYPVGTL